MCAGSGLRGLAGAPGIGGIHRDQRFGAQQVREALRAGAAGIGQGGIVAVGEFLRVPHDHDFERIGIARSLRRAGGEHENRKQGREDAHADSTRGRRTLCLSHAARARAMRT